MRICLGLCLAVAGILPAQVSYPGPQYQISQNLITYFVLTTDQTTRINQLNTDYLRLTISKSQRTAQVQMEIQQETEKQTVDPMALGVRYLELEQIRRELGTEQQKTSTAVQNVLTAEQKTKLTALQDILRTYPTACEAANANLLQQAPTAINGFLGVVTGNPNVNGPIFGSIIPTSCFPSFRSGDFAGTISVLTPGSLKQPQ
jgi:hypothetical protein